MVHVNQQSKLPYRDALFRDFFKFWNSTENSLLFPEKLRIREVSRISGEGYTSVADKMSGFSSYEGVRMLGKSDLVFSLHRCWAYCGGVVTWLCSVFCTRATPGFVLLGEHLGSQVKQVLEKCQVKLEHCQVLNTGVRLYTCLLFFFGLKSLKSLVWCR